MVYLKLSIRNARRSFTNYLLYIAAMTILLAIIEVSNCIAVIGRQAGLQVISLPLLIAMIQIVLAGYIDLFLLKQRAKEFANYLLLGMKKGRLTCLFLCEVLLIGLFCFLAGTTIGFAIYGFWYLREPLYEMKHWGFLSFFCFVCLIGCVCGIVFLPEDYIVYPVSVAAIPLLMAVFAFYKWLFGYLYAKRRMKSVKIYQKDILCIMANSDF